jgi:hypothetical protein
MFMNLSTIGMDFEEFIANLANLFWSTTEVRMAIEMLVIVKSGMIMAIEMLVIVKSRMIMAIEMFVLV